MSDSFKQAIARFSSYNNEARLNQHYGFEEITVPASHFCGCNLQMLFCGGTIFASNAIGVVRQVRKLSPLQQTFVVAEFRRAHDEIRSHPGNPGSSDQAAIRTN